MKNSPDQLSKQLQLLMTELQALEVQDNDPPVRWANCMRLCHDNLRDLRKSVVEQGFPDRNAEIFFFKHVKPVILGRFMYYQRVYQLFLGELKLITQEKQRLSRELDAASQVFERNDTLRRYFRSGDRILDEHYFIRGNENWFLYPVDASFDEQFSTGGDWQLAELLSTELFIEYIDQRLAQYNDPASAPARHQQAATTTCAANVSDIVELGYALHAIGFFPKFKTIKEVMEFLSIVFSIELPKYYDAFNHIKQRKINVTRFLDKLKIALEVYIKTNVLVDG